MKEAGCGFAIGYVVMRGIVGFFKLIFKGIASIIKGIISLFRSNTNE